MNDDELSSRLHEALRAKPHMGNKRSAYRAAGVSPQTFERALSGLPLRADKRAQVEDFIANTPNLEPDTYVSRDEWVEVIARIERLERKVGDDDRSAPKTQTGETPDKREVVAEDVHGNQVDAIEVKTPERSRPHGGGRS